MSKAKVNGKTIYIGANMSAVGNALKDVEEKSKATKNELKTLEKALKLDPQNVEMLTEKQKALTERISQSKEQLERLRSVSARVKADYENGTIDRNQYLNFRTSIAETEAELKRLSKQAEENKKAIQNSGKATEEAGNELKKAGKVADQTGDELKKTGEKAEKAGKSFDIMANSVKMAKTTMNGITKVLKTSLGVFTSYVAGATAVATASIKVGKDFETANSQLAATMGKTVDQIKPLTEKAKELGETTSFSATEAAEGLNILAMSGLNAKEQISTIEPVLNLASAGTLSLAEASSFTTGAVKGFKDEMKNTNYYTDLMAKGATLANTDVRGLGSALSYVSATANSYGQKADKVTLSLLKLAEQNITGETAATMLNRAMADLYTPTDNAKKALDELGIACYDADGKTREFNTVVSELNTKLSTMSDEQANAYKNTIFTTNGLNAFNKMCATSAEKSAEFEKGLASASDGMGAAAQQTETMLDNLSGQLKLMQSAAEGFGLSVYTEMQSPLKDLVKQGTGYITQLNDAFKKDGLTGVIRESGTIFSDIAKQISQSMPDVVKSAVEFAQSFTDGIVSALPSIIPSLIQSGEILFTGLIDGAGKTIDSLIKMLPKYTPKIISSLVKVGKSLIINTRRVFEEIASVLPDIIPDIVSGIGEIISVLSANLLDNDVLYFVPQILKNILTELSKNLPDFVSGLLDFAAYAVGDLIQMLTDTLPEFISGLAELLTDVLLSVSQWLSNPENITGLVNSFVDALTAVINELPTIIGTIVNALPQIIDGIINGILGAIPQIIQAGIKLLVSLVENLPEIIDTIVNALPQIIDSIITAVLDNIPAVIDAGIQLFISLIENLPTIIIEVCKAVPKIVKSVGKALMDRLPDIAKTGFNLFISLVSKIPEIITKIKDGIGKIWNALSEAFKNWISSMKDIGLNILKGLWDGIKNAKDWLFNKISEWCGDIVDGIKSFFGIHSPSKLFADDIGKNLALGIGVGFDRNMDSVTKDMEKSLPTSFDMLPVVNMETLGNISATAKELYSLNSSSLPNSISNNTTDKSITVNVNIDSISGVSGDNDINSVADRIEQIIVHKINMRGRAFA